MTFEDWLPALGAQAAMMTPNLIACAIGLVLWSKSYRSEVTVLPPFSLAVIRVSLMENSCTFSSKKYCRSSE